MDELETAMQKIMEESKKEFCRSWHEVMLEITHRQALGKWTNRQGRDTFPTYSQEAWTRNTPKPNLPPSKPHI